MDKRQPVSLLTEKAGLEHSEWNADLKQFILGLRNLGAADLVHFKTAVAELFGNYRRTYGMQYVLSDLAEPARIQKKVKYVNARYIGVKDKRKFVEGLAADMRTPGAKAAHEGIVEDIHNWPVDVVLEFYDLGSMQHITTALPRKFETLHHHSLRPYAYMNNLGQLVSHLIAGVGVGQFFSRGTRLDEREFYASIWPLFAECLWEAIRGQKPLDAATVEMTLRYKKAMRIISSPDLDPISFLLRHSVPSLSDGPTLRGAFNQLSMQRRWGRAALTTETTGLDPLSGAVIHSQAVFGGKHVSDKTRELAGRIRSTFLRCDDKGVFRPEPKPLTQYLVVDGDWPIESKINLLEAGFAGIFEIAELNNLRRVLQTTATGNVTKE